MMLLQKFEEFVKSQLHRTTAVSNRCLTATCTIRGIILFVALIHTLSFAFQLLVDIFLAAGAILQVAAPILFSRKLVLRSAERTSRTFLYYVCRK
ncbi:hypothetical protein BD410DRAFT_548501 [Rickenella mellea]|uniref:Uncharacterized protein n=1 Tax=Rickenella mellea TaxID=50990 RepID=A0A4Y7PSA8_9AGAM|nr:hypothetical protein BD410DRAFT_548501 [Rickenella mellea]